MTIFDTFKAKNIDELVDWLDEYCYFDDALWIKWFDENHCKKCDAVCCDGDEYAWCELNNKCKFYSDMNDNLDDKQIIRLWLESEI